MKENSKPLNINFSKYTSTADRYKKVSVNLLELSRGDIVKVLNPVPEGTDTNLMAGDHYAIVASNTKGNLHSHVVTVVYATGGINRADLPCNCVIQFYDCLPEPVGTILTNQIVTLDQGNIISVVGHLRKADEENFNRCLISSLALEGC